MNFGIKILLLIFKMKCTSDFCSSTLYYRFQQKTLNCAYSTAQQRVCLIVVSLALLTLVSSSFFFEPYFTSCCMCQQLVACSGTVNVPPNLPPPPGRAWVAGCAARLAGCHRLPPAAVCRLLFVVRCFDPDHYHNQSQSASSVSVWVLFGCCLYSSLSVRHEIVFASATLCGTLRSFA